MNGSCRGPVLPLCSEPSWGRWAPKGRQVHPHASRVHLHEHSCVSAPERRCPHRSLTRAPSPADPRHMELVEFSCRAVLLCGRLTKERTGSLQRSEDPASVCTPSGHPGGSPPSRMLRHLWTHTHLGDALQTPAGSTPPGIFSTGFLLLYNK